MHTSSCTQQTRLKTHLKNTTKHTSVFYFPSVSSSLLVSMQTLELPDLSFPDEDIDVSVLYPSDVREPAMQPARAKTKKASDLMSPLYFC